MYCRLNDESGKVLMDYSHKDGPRIVSDPICEPFHESQSVEVKHKSHIAAKTALPFDATESFETTYASQPWFYGQMSRDEANSYLEKYRTVDGVFLVRESQTNPSSFVLSFVFTWKVHHVQIQPFEENGQPCLSLDCGKTKFYDLLQLVEFYQLNLGALPTKLTHFLVCPKYQH